MADYRMYDLRKEIQDFRESCEEAMNKARLAAFKSSLDMGDDPKEFKERLDEMQRAVDLFGSFFKVMNKFLDLEEVKLNRLNQILKAVEK